MVGDAFWEASIYADEQMASDEHWSESSEGRVVTKLIQRENERLRVVLAADGARERRE